MTESSRIKNAGARTENAGDRIENPDGVRADALRNREALLVAARAVFAEHGIDAPMATVARRARVGVATLYRHFPTRDDLVRGAYTRQMKACVQALTDALDDPDPWHGFQGLIETFCALQREERGFPTAFAAAFPHAGPEHAQAREQAARDLAGLVRRAQAAGALRADFRPSDVPVVIAAHSGLVATLPDDAAASRRLVAYLLQSFRAETADAVGVPLPAPSAQSLHSLPMVGEGLQWRRPSGR
ncbi:Transcriptional regulator, TetR family [Streptomyces sp. YIM 130001]|uniref:TetR/AcrR family transcriptional regulator n=1 Tax=Streptomyces sp. YIM 130001 TaxID=2259644 RepID=UPI000E646170|nr:TetR/AcrR family transcriptional regulator [Streptomyces sp. YIM 130001]RII20744.1 Transcriptional regulator, TetR family [Streptomyces sp. YIM 130001]